jgi:hypothetical protein
LFERKTFEENIFLGSCGFNEILPTNPNFPADFFTSCLTTPIKTALRWFFLNNKLLEGLSIDLLDNIPGKLTDRKTPMGELNWIFTAVTDTIAWSVLPSGKTFYFHTKICFKSYSDKICYWRVYLEIFYLQIE